MPVVLAVLTLVLTAVLVRAEVRGDKTVRAVSKTLASSAFIATAVAVLWHVGDAALGEDAHPGEGHAQGRVLYRVQLVEQLASICQLLRTK